MAFENEGLNAAADAIAPLHNSGFLRLYASNGGDLLVEFNFAATAFGAAVAGVATANAIASSTGLAAAGTGTNVTWYETYKSDGTTLIREGAVTHTSGGGDVKMDNVNVAENQTVNVSSVTITAT